MQDSRIRGPMPPEDEPNGVYRTIVPYVGRPIDLTILDERITSVLAHWITPAESPPAGRTVLHQAEACAICLEGRKRRWCGYLMCWDHSGGQYRIATFSFDGAGLLLKMFPPPLPLRGQMVQMQRLGKSNNNPIWWTRSTCRELSPLPESPDLMPSLVNMYGPEVIKQIARAREEEHGLA